MTERKQRSKYIYLLYIPGYSIKGLGFTGAHTVTASGWAEMFVQADRSGYWNRLEGLIKL